MTLQQHLRDPDPGDEDDPITMNGYSYADGNPIMKTDPDGNWAWAVVNAGFAVYDGYKAYKAGKNKKQVAWAVASSFVKVGHVKKVGTVLGLARKSKAPQKAYRMLEKLKGRSKAPKGFEGGRVFENIENRLPKKTTYREYDVNPLRKGVNRGRQRLVIGKNGKSYYTNDHYKTFKRIK